jgi:hypothetical protein
MKLSDTQLMILSSASQRTDHAAVLPANLKGSAASKVVNKLLNEKLLQELRAKDDNQYGGAAMITGPIHCGLRRTIPKASRSLRGDRRIKPDRDADGRRTNRGRSFRQMSCLRCAGRYAGSRPSDGPCARSGNRRTRRAATRFVGKADLPGGYQ